MAVGASIVGGMMASRAASKGAAAATGAAQSQLGEEQRQFDIVQEQTRPYREVGAGALTSLADMMGISRENPYDAQIAELEKEYGGITSAEGPTRVEGGITHSPDAPEWLREGVRGAAGGMADYDERLAGLKEKQAAFENREKYDFQESPGYQFRLEEGMKGLEASQAGRRLGGRAAKEAMRYGQGMASEEFGKQFGRLSQLAGYGPQATSATIAGKPSTAGYGTMAEAGWKGAEAQSEAIQGTLGNIATWSEYNKPDYSSGSVTSKPSIFNK